MHRDQREGRACRVIEVHDARGELRLRGIAFPWRREIAVNPVDDRPDAGFVIRRRRLFPLTGKLDLLERRGGGRLGVLSRSGRVLGPGGRDLGRFRDARSLRDWGGEALVELVGAIVSGVEGGDPGRMPQERRWILGRREQGRLQRASWPFANPSEETPLPARGLARFLPPRVSRLLRGLGDPRTWRFDWLPLGEGGDPRMPVAAAVWAVELSHW